ncbi:MAG: UDP-3-O-(3-hydroxymyristoyl)glucosamine N-acyltransferase [Bacteroidota bacterium]|nr:UDP-3-O-(3-hydroxymyristoyl)glucosamine N-acyltransferase [Bacteroidota bacterium]
MEFSAQQIAALVNGEIEGDENSTVINLSKIEEGKPKTLSFLGNAKYEHFIYDTEASIVIVYKNFIPNKPLKSSLTLIRVNDPRESFAKLLEMYNQIKNNKVGIEQPSYISNSAKLGSSCYIGAFVYLGDRVVVGNNVKIFPNTVIGDGCTVGDNTIIYGGVKMYSDTKIGNECTIHAGVVLGADGFGFTPNTENNYSKIPQIGNVIIEDNVEIGANTCVDRATLGSTIIRKGVKLDNLIQVAHNCDIGENTVIAGCVAIAGSVKIGKNCLIGGQVGIGGHITIADGVKIAGQSGISSSVEKENDILQGSPAFSVVDYRRSYVLFRSLPKLNDKMNEILKKLNP